MINELEQNYIDEITSLFKDKPKNIDKELSMILQDYFIVKTQDFSDETETTRYELQDESYDE